MPIQTSIPGHEFSRPLFQEGKQAGHLEGQLEGTALNIPWISGCQRTHLTRGSDPGDRGNGAKDGRIGESLASTQFTARGELG